MLEVIKKRISSIKEKILKNKYVTIFYIISFSLIVLSSILGTSEKNIPSQNAFCSPNQVLTFLTMIGIILGVFSVKPDVITKKLGNLIVFVTCFLIFTLFLFILNLTAIFFTGFFILIIVYFWHNVKKDTSGQKYFIGALLFFLTYLISGITGNACSYVITGFEYKLELPYNTFHQILGVPGQTYDYQDISCSIGNIQVKKLTKDYPDDLLAVLLYENFNYTQPYKTVFIREGEHLTLCCFRWKLVEKKSDTTIWEQYDMLDIFCRVQNWLYVKGVYRT